VEEEDDVAVLDDVVPPFGAGFAALFGFGAPLVVDHIIEGDHFGADKPLLNIGVDLAGGFLGSGIFGDGPGAGLLLAGGEEGDKFEGAVPHFDEPI